MSHLPSPMSSCMSSPSSRSLITRLAPLTLPLVLVLVLVLAACNSPLTTTHATPVGTAPGATGTATKAPIPPVPAVSALTWIQLDSKNGYQVVASINGAPATVLAHIAQPAADCGYVDAGPPILSPDRQHAALALGFGCTDGQFAGPLALINVGSGHVSLLNPPNNSTLLSSERSYAWENNSTLLALTYNGVYEYSLSHAKFSALSGTAKAVDGVVRGRTLFYLVATGTSSGDQATLHRYDLAAHHVLSGSISLGGVSGCQCSPGNFHFEGWDVSADGQHVVFQRTTPKPSGSFGGIGSSTIYYANADGSGATPIAQYMVTSSLVRLRIAPDGRHVAFTTALPSPSVISACVDSPGTKGDPCFHSYTPDAVAYPAWSADSSSFYASSAEVSDAYGAGAHPTLYRYTLGKGTGASAVPGGLCPWSLP